MGPFQAPQVPATRSQTLLRSKRLKLRIVRTSTRHPFSALARVDSLAAAMPGRVFKGCVVCNGTKQRPRNGRGGKTCSASSCKEEYKERRAAGGQQAQLGGVETELAAEKMPFGMWVHEVEEILGERCCELRQLSKKKRKNGPGSAYLQEFLVRGSFLEADGDGEDSDEDEAPEPNTFWVDKDDLLETIALEDVKDALKARHDAVMGDL